MALMKIIGIITFLVIIIASIHSWMRAEDNKDGWASFKYYLLTIGSMFGTIYLLNN